MDPSLFLADLEEKPARLLALADALRADDPWAAVGETRRWVFVGMGSSHYAGQVAAARLRTRGVDAVAESAGSDLLPLAGPGTTVVAVSASGGSRETVDAVRRLRGTGRPVRRPDQPRRHRARGALRRRRLDAGRPGARRGGLPVVPAHAGAAARPRGLATAASPTTSSRAPRRCAHLLETRDTWLPALSAAALGPQGTHVVAPARRLSSALQSALMLREGPRLPAYACETADWSHVDVYLTRTTDYRLVLLAGSRWEDELLTWVRERGSTLVAVGAEVEGAALTVRYPHDDVDDVRLLAETLVCCDASLGRATANRLSGARTVSTLVVRPRPTRPRPQGEPQPVAAFCRARKAATLARDEQRSEQ